MGAIKHVAHDATARRAWIVERRAVLDEFDRLCAKGLTQARAAARLGVTRPGIRAMRASIEAMEEGAPLLGHAKTARVDLGLALLSIVRRPGEALTAQDIAAWCDCSHQTISRIERRALAKLRTRLAEAAAHVRAVEWPPQSPLAGLPRAA